MSVDQERLAAYLDGELGAIEAARVEREVAADPEAAAELEQLRALNDRLRGTFAPIAEAPVPAGIEEILRRSEKIVPFPAPATAKPRRLGWIGAVAASLVAGLLLGQLVPGGGGDGFAFSDGQAVARGEVARALGTQLASTQPADAPVRIGVTFRDGAGDLCRTFERGGSGGIACHRADGWQLARFRAGQQSRSTDYRQAGSASGEMMAEAQAMMAGEPLDAAAEAAALDALSSAR